MATVNKAVPPKYTGWLAGWPVICQRTTVDCELVDRPKICGASLQSGAVKNAAGALHQRGGRISAVVIIKLRDGDQRSAGREPEHRAVPVSAAP